MFTFANNLRRGLYYYYQGRQKTYPYEEAEMGSQN
jgi:hypothetical protein